jgi:ER membrane protein complex subunit 1, C-terminal
MTVLFLSIVGDQSILMKYANPHTVLLTYFSSEKGSQQSEAPLKDEGESLYAALVDTVSNKILYRILLSKTASKPVHTLLVENHVIVTYWNAKAKRTELSSSALYEGMVDVFGLSPLSSFSALPQQIRDADHSSFTSPLPLGIQRTYVIPRMVTSLHHTVTSRGNHRPPCLPLLYSSPCTRVRVSVSLPSNRSRSRVKRLSLLHGATITSDSEAIVLSYRLS